MNMKKYNRSDLVYNIAMIIVSLISLGVSIGFIYIVCHFAAKYW